MGRALWSIRWNDSLHSRRHRDETGTTVAGPLLRTTATVARLASHLPALRTGPLDPRAPCTPSRATAAARAQPKRHLPIARFRGGRHLTLALCPCARRHRRDSGGRVTALPRAPARAVSAEKRLLTAVANACILPFRLPAGLDGGLTDNMVHQPQQLHQDGVLRYHPSTFCDDVLRHTPSLEVDRIGASSGAVSYL